MRTRKRTKAKTLLGMLILFFVIPAFIVLYAIFFLNLLVDITTIAIIILAAIVLGFLAKKYYARKKAKMLGISSDAEEEPMPLPEQEMAEAEEVQAPAEEQYEEYPPEQEPEPEQEQTVKWVPKRKKVTVTEYEPLMEETEEEIVAPKKPKKKKK